MKVFLVHAGSSPVPEHTMTAMQQAKLWGYEPLLLTDADAGAHSARFDQVYAGNVDFRDGFWKHTIGRFMILADYLSSHPQTDPVLHIENDVLLLAGPDIIMATGVHPIRLGVVQDAMSRCIPSIVTIPNIDALNDLVDYIITQMKRSPSNDMQLLGAYPGKFFLPSGLFGDVIYDGAALGQYLAGTDPRNGPSAPGFVNETCVTVCLDRVGYQFIKSVDPQGRCIYHLKNPIGKVQRIVNLHIHTKRLTEFTN